MWRADSSLAESKTAEEAEAPFNQVEWAQENPVSENHHVLYPQIEPTVFHRLIVNSARPSPAVLYSQWMSVNHSNLAPTTLHADSFTLGRAPAVSAAGAQYLRLFAAAGAAFDKFQTERTSWCQAEARVGSPRIRARVPPLACALVWL